jgi:hypothetical protein
VWAERSHFVPKKSREIFDDFGPFLFWGLHKKKGFGFETRTRKKMRCLSLPLAEGAPDSQNGAV